MGIIAVVVLVVCRTLTLSAGCEDQYLAVKYSSINVTCILKDVC